MFNPTYEQEAIITAGVRHILYDYGNTLDFGYTGGAGTGKSTVLMEMIRRIGIPLDRIAPMAYTGQAAMVLRRKGLLNAKTIHSWIYKPHEVIMKDKDGRPIMDEKYGRPKTKIEYTLDKHAMDEIDYIIVDEDPMCPELMAKHLMSFGKKIIRCGDDHQCDPIIGKSGFVNDEHTMKLTQVLRQSKGSSILDIAYAYYNGVNVRPGKYGNDVIVIDEEDFDRSTMTCANITICSYNKTRDDLNHWYRANVIKTCSHLPILGERVVCKRNNWDIEVDGIPLVNGLTGTVTKPITASDIDIRENTFDMQFLPDQMVDPFNVTCNTQYIKAPYTVRMDMKKNPATANELFEFAYANTVYSAQGSEYPCGIYYREPFGRTGIQNKIDYTAITRFAKRAIIILPTIKRFY